MAVPVGEDETMKEITEEELMKILDRELSDQAIKGTLYGPVVRYASKKRAVDAIMDLIRGKVEKRP
jgi:hypothetical protein